MRANGGQEFSEARNNTMRLSVLLSWK